MDMLMLGAGVGFSVAREHISKLPIVKKVKIQRIDTNDADFIIPDSREGWVKLLKKTLTQKLLLKLLFITNKYIIKYYVFI